jgi:hypothetical protein
MISKTFLQKFAMKVKQGHGQIGNDNWWGGLNVILCGDFHQFPPVAVGWSKYLFTPIANEETANHPKAIGCKIYDEFSTVVILRTKKSSR